MSSEEERQLTLQQIIAHLRENPSLTAHEKLLYTPDKIMMLLEPSNLDLLKNQFLTHSQEGLNLESFLWLMTHTIPFRPEEKFDFYYSLMKLFKRIDIDGNQKLDWQEFITYIIQAVKESSATGDFSSVPSSSGSSVPQEQMIKHARATQPRIFKFSETVKDLANRGTAIKKLEYIRELDSIVCLEEMKDFIRFYDPSDLRERTHRKITLTDIRSSANLFSTNKTELLLGGGKKGQITCIESYAYGKNTFIILTNKRQVLFFERDEETAELDYSGAMNLNYQALKVYYLPLHNMIMASDHEFRIHQIHKPPRRQDDPIPENLTFKAHSNMIVDIKEVPSPLCVVSASMDGSIKLWDLKKKNQLLRTLDDESFQIQTKAVKGIEVCYLNMIASWGFDCYVTLWCPEHSLIKPFYGRLQCNAMVIDAKNVPESIFLITLDAKNTIRVWDIRKMICTQFISCASDQLGLMALENSFVLYSRKMIFYEKSSMNQKDNELKREILVPLNIHLNIDEGILCVLTTAGIRIYNGKTGGLEAVHSDILPGQAVLSCFVKENERKFIMGGVDGAICMADIGRGHNLNKIKQPEKNSAQITGMYLYQAERVLISVSNMIQTYHESEGEWSLIKTIYLPENEAITYLQFSEQHLLFLLATENSRFMVWSFEKSKLLHSQVSFYPIVSVHFVSGYHCFVVVTKAAVEIYSINHMETQFPLVARVIYNPEDDDTLAESLFESVSPVHSSKKIPMAEYNITGFLRTSVSFQLQEGNIKGGQSRFESQVKTKQSQLKGQTQNQQFWVIGDSVGRVSFMDAKPLLECLHPISKIHTARPVRFFQFKRPETIHIKHYLDYKQTNQPKYVLKKFHQFVTIIHSHSDAVNKVVEISKIQCIGSCSLDLTVKIFNNLAQIVCSLDMLKATPKLWNFPFDWIQYNMEIFEDVQSVANKIDGKDPVTDKVELDRLKAKFLMGLYMGPEVQKQLIKKFMVHVQNVISNKKNPKVNPKKQLTQSFLELRQKVRKMLEEEYEIILQKLETERAAKSAEVKKRSQKAAQNPPSSTSIRKRTTSVKVMKTTAIRETENEGESDSAGLSELKKELQFKRVEKSLQKIERPQRIMNTTRRNFIANNNYMYRLSLQSQKRIEGSLNKKNLVKDVMLHPGTNNRLVYTGSRLATDRFLANTQPNQWTPQLFRRMKVILNPSSSQTQRNKLF